MYNSISRSQIFVLDQDQAVAFYVDTLGLEIASDVDLGFMRWLTVRVPGDVGREILLARPGPPAMDEATAALDSITEREIIETIEELAGKLTIIMIAHRLNTVKHCDMIYLFDKGKIVDLGTYHALLERNKQFQDMAKWQSRISLG